MHFRRAERHDRFAGGQKPPGKVADPRDGSVLQTREALARRRTEEDLCAAGGGTEVSGVRSTGGDCRQCPPTADVRRSRNPPSARGRWRIGRSPVRPVLKHGPRSLTRARVVGCYETYRRSESKGRSSRSTRVGSLGGDDDFVARARGRTTGPSRPHRW